MVERTKMGWFEPKNRRASSPTAQAELLTSRDNKWLKEFRAALRGGAPTTDGAVGIEGARLVEEALGSGCKIAAILFSESGEKYRDRLAPITSRTEPAFPVLRTTDRLFEGIADTEHPQGVAALVVPRKFEIGELLAMPEEACSPLLVVLAGVQDPGNVGTILRTAAAFGVTGAVTAATGHSGTASPFAPKTLRASAGAALHLPIVSGMPLGILLTQFKLNGIRTLATCVEDNPPVDAERTGSGIGASATSSRSTVVPWEVDWCQASALLVGNEGTGLPEEVLQGADVRVHIPMARNVESLNAGGAAAVLLYEAYRQRAGRS